MKREFFFLIFLFDPWFDGLVWFVELTMIFFSF